MSLRSDMRHTRETLISSSHESSCHLGARTNQRRRRVDRQARG
jgi:hypothetical protein